MMNFGQTQHKLFGGPLLQAVCLLLFLFPLFFQLSGAIFTAEGMNFDSQGSLFLIPLPLASVTCFIGIIALIRSGRNHFGVGFIFSVFMLMMLSTLVSTAAEGGAELAKYILLIQFLLPMFGLVLGYLYIEPDSDYLKFEAIALYVLLIIVPCEMISTGMKASPILAPDLFIFSLYQHLQYLPTIFVSLYFLAVVTLFENRVLKYLILFLAPWLGAYIAAALSMMTIVVAVVLGLISLVALVYRGQKWGALLLIILLAASFSSYYPSVKKSGTYAQKYDLNINATGSSGANRLSLTHGDLSKEKADKLITKYEQKIERVEGKYSQYSIYRSLPNNIKERFIYWEFYSKGIIESPKIFLFGHKDRPQRELYPSAHNYYLDLVYHFGIISVLPIIYLVSLVFVKSIEAIREDKMTSKLFALLIIVLVFVFVDNFLKVSFRQPYSGTVTFFFWGVLLSRLKSVNKHSRLNE